MALPRGTNFYFNNYNSSGEQRLYEDLIIEAIKMYGIDLFYLPRTLISKDDLYGEDDVSEYNEAIPIEMYITSVDGFEGDGVFMSKFGLEIRDQVTFTVARRIFNEEVCSQTELTRPRESDLIWFPLNEKLFQIKYVNYKPFFFQFGQLPIYDLVCELYEYSNEVINTGIPEIDKLQVKHSTNLLDYAIVTENNQAIGNEHGQILTWQRDVVNLKDIDPISDNDQIQAEADEIIDWSEIDPFSDGGRY